jgi:uncharacterized protein (TIGR02145 family)
MKLKNIIVKIFVAFLLLTIYASSCEKDKSDQEPDILTPIVVTNLPKYEDGRTAVIFGTVTDSGCCKVISRGFCWGNTMDPELSDHNTSCGFGTGEFNDTLTNLNYDAIYYIRAFAINDEGISYGNNEVIITQQFNIPCKNGITSVTDIDGNVYETVLIGEQCWMKENLKTTRYSNGEEIMRSGSVQKTGLNKLLGSYSFYENKAEWEEYYGYLYNWHAVTNTNGLCPKGWHIPSQDEWNELTGVLGDSIMLGRHLKSTRTEPENHPRWNAPNTDVSNKTGFSGLPGGYIKPPDSYNEIGERGFWWSSTENNDEQAWMRILSHNNNIFYNSEEGYKHFLFSVRCLKDSNP